MPEPLRAEAPKTWLLLADAAAVLVLPEEVVLDMALMGDLEGRMENGRELVSRESVDAWLLQREAAPSGLAMRFPREEETPPPASPREKAPGFVVRRMVPGKGLWPPVR